MSETAPVTVPQVLDATAARHPNRIALRQNRDGRMLEIDWRTYREKCRAMARALVAVGVAPGEGVAILGYNAPEWIFADVGAILVGAIPAGIYTTSSPEQTAYIAVHCDARVAFADDAVSAKKFLAAKDKMPLLRHVVQWGGTLVEDPLVESYDAFVAHDKGVTDATLAERAAAQKPDDACTLIYTSGTTGNPKGVLLSHKNLIWTADKAVFSVGLDHTERGVSYLPLSHIAEQMLTIHGPLFTGHCVTIAESLEKLPDALREVRPTYFMGVPRVWEKIQQKMMAAGASASPLRKRIAAWARKQGMRGGSAIQRGEKLPLGYRIAERFVFSKVKERIGLDQCKLAVSGAAPISRDTLDFFLSLGIPIYEVYGMSESSGPATYSTPQRFRIGKVGVPFPETEVKIAEDGEILIKGPHVFVGYLKDEHSTREMVKDGWLQTGDVGELDADGFLAITDRKKELIITAGGENVAPQLIEGALKSIPVIAQAVAIGDRRKYVSALLTLDPERVPVDAAAIGSPAKTPAEAATCAVLRAHVEAKIVDVNKTLARVQNVRKFVLLAGALTIDGGELTPTMKLRRKIILAKYAKEIESMYHEVE
ncbi:long-chain fatty acid--CoA ligase [soil metagenome]